jgi:hypothetical protein
MIYFGIFCAGYFFQKLGKFSQLSGHTNDPSQGILRGKYHCTIDLLFDCFGISCMTTDNFCFHLQNRLIQTSQPGGQWYSDTSPFSIHCPCMVCLLDLGDSCGSCGFHEKDNISLAQKQIEVESEPAWRSVVGNCNIWCVWYHSVSFE